MFFLFIAVEDVPAATRFANRDWRDIVQVLPIIDRFVRAVGDIPDVIGKFPNALRALARQLSGRRFVEQTRAASASETASAQSEGNDDRAARIAALVRAFAEKSVPLPPSLAQAMLRILDRLVDMGDRRSERCRQARSSTRFGSFWKICEASSKLAVNSHADLIVSAMTIC